MSFIKECQPEAYEFNPSSTQQLQQLLFAPFKRKKSTDNKIDQNKKNYVKTIVEDNEEDNPLKITRNLTEINDFSKTRYFKVAKIPDFEYPEYIENPKNRKLKFRQMPVIGYGIKSIKESLSGLPSVDTDVLKKLSDGPIENHFKYYYK